MKVLVVGASGATGRLVIAQLLEQNLEVIAIVRSLSALGENSNLRKIEASVHKLTSSELAIYLKDCDAVVSCLGHNITFKGLFGKPYLLVTETLQSICQAIKLNKKSDAVKVILLNTAGNSNRDIFEKPPLSQRIVIAMLRVFLPPLRDNEGAVDFLRTQIRQRDQDIEWVAIRPDTLIDASHITKYNLFSSPIRNVIFDPGATSRVNVADFIVRLILDKSVWEKWKGKMPVIYNKNDVIG